MGISIGKQVIQNIVGDLEYKVECTGGSVVNMSNYNGKVFINGIEAPNEEGTYKIKSIPDGILKIKRHKGLFGKNRGSVVQNISGVTGKNVCIENHGVLNNYSDDKKKSSNSIRLDKGEHKESYKGFDGVKVVNGDYTVSGMSQIIRNVNIEVYGDVVVSGMNNKVIRGKKNVNLSTLKIRGDLVVSGMENRISTLTKCYGDLVTSGLNCEII